MVRILHSDFSIDFKRRPFTGSKPHFLDADPVLLQSVEGLNPNRSAHDIIVNFEAASSRSSGKYKIT